MTIEAQPENEQPLAPGEIPLGPLDVLVTGNVSRPVECLEIHLNNPFGAPDIRIVNADSLIQFEGKIYSPLPFRRDPIQTSIQNTIDGYRIGVDNAGQALVRFVQENRFNGARMVLRKVFRPSPQRLSSIVLFDGKVQSIEVGEQSIHFITSSILEAFNQNAPKRLYQTRCGYRFGDQWCGLDLSAESRNYYGFANRGSNSGRIIDPAQVGEPDEKWDAGYVVMVEGPDLGQHRPVARFEGDRGVIVLRFPFENNTLGHRFRVVQGCKKTKVDCRDRHNNLANYGGFAEIPSEPTFR